MRKLAFAIISFLLLVVLVVVTSPNSASRLASRDYSIPLVDWSRVTPSPTFKPKKQITASKKQQVTPTPKKTTATPRPTAIPVPDGFSALQAGDKGEWVKDIQARLTELGYLDDRIDGIFGKKTKQAVCDFQSANKLSASGVVDDVTYGVLFSVLARPAPTLRPTSTPTPAPKKTKQPNPTYRESASQGTKYVLNTNSHKFHKPSCRHVKRIKPSNYKEFTGDRDEVIRMGYVPCKTCYP